MAPRVNVREAETSRLSPATSSSPNQILAPPRVWATLHLRDQAGAEAGCGGGETRSSASGAPNEPTAIWATTSRPWPTPNNAWLNYVNEVPASGHTCHSPGLCRVISGLLEQWSDFVVSFFLKFNHPAGWMVLVSLLGSGFHLRVR